MYGNDAICDKGAGIIDEMTLFPTSKYCPDALYILK